MPPFNSLVSKSEAYRLIRIPKGNGAFRELCIAPREVRRELRQLLPELEQILAQADTSKANYAFQKGRNCALNALQHVGRRYTLSLDIHDFFDSVTPAHVAGIIPDLLIERCFFRGRPRQGLPTSPLIATIAFLACDKRIIAGLKALSIEAVYTRYADDLIFSFDERSQAGKIATLVDNILRRQGFKLNKRKTRLQDARNGRIVITGVSVDLDGLHPTRTTRRKIRAAVHQQNAAAERGLREWAECRLPRALTG